MLFSNSTLGIGKDQGLFDFGKPLALALETLLHLAQIVRKRMKAGLEVCALFVVRAPIVMGAPVAQGATLISNTRRDSSSNSSGRGARNPRCRRAGRLLRLTSQRRLDDPGVSVDQPLFRGCGFVRRNHGRAAGQH